MMRKSDDMNETIARFILYSTQRFTYRKQPPEDTTHSHLKVR